MAIRPSNMTLNKLPEAVARPDYDRSSLAPGILHFGVGNFHRAHQAVYLDDLFNTGRDHDWALVGTGVMPGDKAMREILERQDFLTTIVEQSADTSTARITGPMTGFIEPGNAAANIAAMADPGIRIVSLTVTEGGYYIDPATGRFDPTNAAIILDGSNPDQPQTAFGMIVAGLARRRENGMAPFTVMSCDNIPHNGVVTRNTVAGVARLSDPALADWIEENVAFPNGMVDRITPATGDRERTICRDDFGIDDAWPVFCEDFKQWVLEDNFTSGRPRLEDVGVQFVDDVSPYELMKIRILNGGHAVIAYPAGLLDIHFVHEAMQHPLVRGFLDKLQRNEIIPVVPPVPDTSLSDYYELIVRRFSNPKIADTVRRLCFDGSNRQPKFIIPSIADNLAKGRDVDGLALESALWCRYCFGTTDSGTVIESNDPNWSRLVEHAKRAKDDPRHWLAMDDIYGDLAQNPDFSQRFGEWLRRIWTEGTEAVLKSYLAN